MSTSKPTISAILSDGIQAIVTRERGADFGRATTQHLKETFDDLGRGIERKLDAAISKQYGEDELDGEARDGMVEKLGNTLAKKLAESVILPELKSARNIQGAITPLSDVKEALNGLEESELDAITRQEIQDAIAKPSKKKAAKPPDPDPTPINTPRAQPRPPVAPTPRPSPTPSFGGKGS